MDWFFTALKRYVVFSGRSARPEFWYFALFYMVGAIGMTVLDAIAGTVSARTGAGLFGSLFGLALFLPAITVGVRRLHDTDRSGWWMLISVVPVIGALVLLFFAVQPGTPGPNRFGDAALEVA